MSQNPDSPAARTTANSRTASGDGWMLPLLLLAVGIAILLTLYWGTADSMVQIWTRSDTFAHGFLILPISLYLIWLKYDDLRAVSPRYSVLGLVALALCTGGWLAATLLGIQVGQQLALVSMLIALVWALLGWPVVRLLLFPLAFLFFMVPIGEFLVLPMMEFTAEFSVFMIRLTGIPVYWEGFYISLPSGDWSIVEGCSGVRYLIASIAVGVLYAYLFYYATWRRLAFVLLAILAPIIGNGLRAFMIIMIGHFSDMKLATGVDHLIYGWVFFGLIMMLMFWIGSFWWDKPPETDTSAERAPEAGTGRHYLWGAPLVFALLLAAPVLMQSGNADADDTHHIAKPKAAAGWRSTGKRLAQWKPHFRNPSAVRVATYQHDGRKVEVYLFYYQNQDQGAELVNSQNMLIPQKHHKWHMRSAEPTTLTLDGEPLHATESLLRSRRASLLVWQWYWIDGHSTISGLDAKLHEAWQRLRHPDQGSFAVVLATAVDDQPKPAHAALQSFVDAMWPSIQGTLRETIQGESE